MSIMTDSTLFSRIKTLNAAGALVALKKSLHDSGLDQLAAKVPAFRPPRRHYLVTWKKVSRALDYVASLGSVDVHSIENMEQILGLCAKRVKQEKRAKKFFACKYSFQLWQQVGHLQSNTVRPALEKWLNRVSGGGSNSLNDYVKRFGAWWGLIEAVRAAQKSFGAASNGFTLSTGVFGADAQAGAHTSDWTFPILPENASAASWESVLVFMLKEQAASQEECDAFGTCELCWRFVPFVQASGHHRFYCTQHTWNTQEYKRALEIKKCFNDASDTLEIRAAKLYKATRECWIASHDNLPEDWVALLANDVVSLARHITVPLDYDTKIIEQYFPHVCRFVVQQGGAITPHDLVEYLDPIQSDLAPAIRERWEALHHVFISNLALFRRELCHAEVFLDCYDRLYAHVKHGGFRAKKSQSPTQGEQI